MTLEMGDRELFALAELLNKDGSESGTRILFDYWDGKGGFHNLRKVFGGVPGISSMEEVQYVFASEHICARMIESMGRFISGPVCGPDPGQGAVPQEAAASGRELIARMASLRDISPRRGWESFYKELSECAASMIREIDSLTFFHAGNTNVHVCTNANIDNVFSRDTNYREKAGTFFVFEG